MHGVTYQSTLTIDFHLVDKEPCLLKRKLEPPYLFDLPPNHILLNRSLVTGCSPTETPHKLSTERLSRSRFIFTFLIGGPNKMYEKCLKNDKSLEAKYAA